MFVYLDKGDFFVENNVLGVRYEKPILVMIYSLDCIHCSELKPLFLNLKLDIDIGILNISSNPGIMQMAKNSTTKIEYVPKIILYKNGVPKGEFKDELSRENVNAFINKLGTGGDVDLNKMNNYGSGIPNSKRVCYLSFDEAYKKVGK